MSFKFTNFHAIASPISVAVFSAIVAWLILAPSSNRDGTNAPFAMFPAHKNFRKSPKIPDWGNFNIPREYRPFIEIDVRRGPNFAGVYTLVPYTCDGLCKEVFVILLINARTGKIIKRSESKKYKLNYQLNSRLLVLRPRSSEESEKIVYLLFSGDGFVELKPREMSDL